MKALKTPHLQRIANNFMINGGLLDNPGFDAGGIYDIKI